MSSSIPEAFKAAVLTVSDSCARGQRVDLSGPAVSEALRKRGFTVVTSQVVSDEETAIQESILRMCDLAQLIVTTGGTGIAARDVTPEATRTLCDRLLDGVAERMRLKGSEYTPFAALSRGVCGVRGKALILNLPGNPKGAVQSLESVVELLPHALHLLNGVTQHS